MNKYISKIGKCMVHFMNYCTPKNKNKVLFASSPSFTENPWAIYNYMMNNEAYKNFSFVWLVDKTFSSPHNTSRTKFIKNRSLMEYCIYLCHVFTSKYLFTSHSHFIEACPTRQKCIQLWHGTMLKCINMMHQTQKGSPKDYYTYFTTPSDFYIDIFCKSFGVSEDKMITTGYPRVDLLFQDTGILKDLGIEGRNFKKIITYLPTFRIPKGGGYVDCYNTLDDSLIRLGDKEDMLLLNEQLSSMNILMVVKLHPYDSFKPTELALSNIILLDNASLQKKHLQLYNLLRYSDALITDYSSVFCDYMVLNRPIAFIVTDIEQYKNSRGFVYDKPLENMPGSVLANRVDLMKFLVEVYNDIDSSAECRQRLMKQYNKFTDGNNCSRVLAAIGL